jgi:hypothetical protein
MFKRLINRMKNFIVVKKIENDNNNQSIAIDSSSVSMLSNGNLRVAHVDYARIFETCMA